MLYGLVGPMKKGWNRPFTVAQVLWPVGFTLFSMSGLLSVNNGCLFIIYGYSVHFIILLSYYSIVIVL